MINSWSIRNHPNSSIVEIDHNTKKSPGDLRRLAITQNPVESHQITDVKNSQTSKIIRCVLGTVPKVLVKIFKEVKIKRGDHPDHSIFFRSTKILRRVLQS